MNIQEALEKVGEIDLSPILWKLKHPVKGEQLSDEQLRHAEERYREWLVLNLMYPEKSIVPSELVDQVWHAHILDTAKYAEDCERLFGRFMHHYPYSGWLDAELHEVEWEQTRELWMAHFGVEMAGQALCERGYCDPDIHVERPSYAVT